MTLSELEQRMTLDELTGWAARDEMLSIFRSIRAADRKLPDAEMLRMVIEEQTANNWHGRIS
jgi:hypothetical protein